MKILHVTPSYYPAVKYGGPIQSVHLLNKFLIKKGVDVDVFTTTAGLENENIVYDDWNVIDNVRVKYFKYYGYEHYNFSPTIFIELTKRVSKYDLVHITAVWNFPVLVASLSCLIKNKPFIISPRGTINYEAINLRSKYLKRLYYNMLAKHYIKRASALHFTSQDEKDNVIKSLRLNNKFFIVPNGLDLSKFKKLPLKGAFKEKFPSLNGKRYILFLGRINLKKGIDILLESFKDVLGVYNDIYLVIVGSSDDNYLNILKKMIANMKIEDKVIFTGFLSGDEKLAAYVDAEFFVLPSRSENFGMSVIEAMACGLPVLVSDKVGISKEISINASGIVFENEINKLTKAISNLFEDKAKKETLSKNGKKLVERKCC